MHQGLTGHCAFLLAIIASLSEPSRRNKFELCNVIYSIGWCKGAADLSVCLLLVAWWIAAMEPMCQKTIKAN